MVVSPVYVSLYGNTPTSVKYYVTFTYFIIYLRAHNVWNECF